jgi:hypothetical protein
MKAVRLADVKELLSGQAFSTWWAEHGRAVLALREARARHEELVAQAEMMELRSEKHLEEAREALAAAAQGKPRTQAEQALREAEKEHERTRGEYEAFDGRRHKLWDEVEEAWSKSCERALLAAEHGVMARQVRREAERLFKEAEERRTRAKALRADAEAAGRERADTDRKRVELLRVAAERFGCMAGDGWLYWRHKDDKRSAVAVSLADVPEGANLEVRALGIYTVGLQRGIGLLEPAREGAPAEGHVEALPAARKAGDGAPPAPSGAA